MLLNLLGLVALALMLHALVTTSWRSRYNLGFRHGRDMHRAGMVIEALTRHRSWIDPYHWGVRAYCRQATYGKPSVRNPGPPSPPGRRNQP